jgi:hypothetical protein
VNLYKSVSRRLVMIMLLLYRARGSAAIVFTRPTMRVNRASA